jgi:hypothetical protein
MIGLLGEDLLEDRARPELVGVRLVGGRRRRVQREGVEDRSFPIVGIAAVDLLHGLLVGGGPRAVIELVVVAIVRLDRADVVLLARRHRQPSRLVEGGRALLQHRGARRRPERVVDAHRDAPVPHRARGVRGRDRRKSLQRLLVPERVQERDRALEVSLDGGRAGDGEAHASELFAVVGGRDRSAGEHQHAERKGEIASIHDGTSSADRARHPFRFDGAAFGQRS